MLDTWGLVINDLCALAGPLIFAQQRRFIACLQCVVGIKVAGDNRGAGPGLSHAPSSPLLHQKELPVFPQMFRVISHHNAFAYVVLPT